ncbi:SCO2322 family protein [Arsenicicoccus cauae]|uniref:SCO2322 family protein n=1 Tax=Arsenicicoccus cauae TaxID=2663847 RepID=UPI00370DBC8D
MSSTSRSISRAGRPRRAGGNVVTPITAVLALFLATLLSAFVSTIALAAPAHAADAYRFWGYYQLTNGTWGFATKGPDGTTPADGSVEGYRFALGDTSTPRLPRAVVTFDQACASTPAVSGSKRVGVVVDFGRAADAREQGATVPAPYATCVTVPTSATGAQVLAAAAKPRVEKAMVCGIDGYPASGCSDTVADVPAAAKAADQPVTIDVRSASSSAATSGAAASSSAAAAASSSSSSSTTAYVVGVVAVLALLAAAAWAMARRRRTDGR